MKKVVFALVAAAFVANIFGAVSAQAGQIEDLKIANGKAISEAVDKGYDGDGVNIVFYNNWWSRRGDFSSDAKNATRAWSPDANVYTSNNDKFYSDRYISISQKNNDNPYDRSNLQIWESDLDGSDYVITSHELKVPGFGGDQASARIASTAANLVDKFGSDGVDLKGKALKDIILNSATNIDGTRYLNVAGAFAPQGGLK